jgi:hypothetical protein
MTGISSKESQELLPHGQAVWDSVPEIESRPEPCGQSRPAWASRLDPEASLRILAPLGAGGVSACW